MNKCTTTTGAADSAENIEPALSTAALFAAQQNTFETAAADEDDGEPIDGDAGEYYERDEDLDTSGNYPDSDLWDDLTF